VLDGNDAGIFDIQRDEKNVGVLVLKERLDREKAGLYTLTIRYNPSLNYSSLLFKSYSPSGTNCPCIIHPHCKKRLVTSRLGTGKSLTFFLHYILFKSFSTSGHTLHQVQTVPALLIPTI
jgi:hypothetical protein